MLKIELKQIQNISVEDAEENMLEFARREYKERREVVHNAEHRNKYSP